MPQGPVKVRNGLVYVGGGSGLVIYDATDPTDPKQLCKVTTGVSVWSSGSSLDLVDDLLFVAGQKGLAIFDVSDPVAPQKLSVFKSTNSGYTSGLAIAVLGNYAFLSGFDGLCVVDVTDPAKPKEMKALETGVIGSSVGGHMDVVGKTLFVIGSKGLGIFDVSDPVNLVRLSKSKTGAVSSMAACLFVKVVAQTVYVVGQRGLAVIDATNPASPTLQYRVKNTEVYPNCVDVQGDHIYVTGDFGFAVYKQNKGKPERIAKVDTGLASTTWRTMITVVDSLAYIIGGYGLAIFDISDPANPSRLSKTKIQLFHRFKQQKQFGVTEVKAEYIK